MELNKLVKGLLAELNKVSKSETVVGTVRDAGKAKVVPLSRVSIGFGTAVGSMGGTRQSEKSSGDAGGEGGGAGGALVVEPKAFVVVGEDGVPHMLALKRGRTAVMRRGIEILPEGEDKARLAGTKAPALGTGDNKGRK
jgi:uncharacterized spore protein YtfJ